MIRISKDYFNNIVPPDYVLCKANKERIGVLKCTEKTLDVKFNDLNEITFKTSLYIKKNKKNPYYEEVDVMKYILLPKIGFFCISSVNVESEGTNNETKSVTARSAQCVLAQKYLELFSINTGEEESLDGVQFYNLVDQNKSLLHLILKELPNWSIGHVDPTLVSKQRSFTIDRKDVYGFLTSDVANAFECIFVFNTLNNTVNAYEEKTLCIDTNLHVSYNNLLKNVSMNCSVDDIKTALKIYGQDDMTIRNLNMGYDKIYNFSYYNSTYYWSEGLYNAYNKWVKLRESYNERYTELLDIQQEYIDQEYYLTYTMMPETTAEEGDWTKYGLEPLRSEYEAYLARQDASMKAGHGNIDSEYYKTEYEPILNTLNDISEEMVKRQGEINLITIEQTITQNRLSQIQSIISIENNFTQEQYNELSMFIREEELTTDNFLITDAMSPEEIYEQTSQLYKYGNEELAKKAVPQLSFDADIVNLFAIPEIYEYIENEGKFDVGNYIWVTLRDDYSIKARLLSMHINFYDDSDFSVTFGNIAKAKNIFTDVSDALSLATDAATSVSLNSPNWKKTNVDTQRIDQMISDGLIASGNRLTTADSTIVMDNRGMFVNTNREGFESDSIYIGDSQILFTQDNWVTVEEAIGRVMINGESVFGVIAKAVLAGHIIGSTITGGIIEGNEIYGNTITGNDIYGNTITVGDKDNKKGAFIVLDKDGNEAGRWDCDGIIFPPNATITWSQVTGTDGVANKDDIPTKTSQLTNDSDYKTGEQVTIITKNTVTTSYVNALEVTAKTVLCENLTGTVITGKRFRNEDETIGINADQSDGWAIYAGKPLQGAVTPYTDQRIFNVGHGGEMYAQVGTFKYLRLEDRCASENAKIDFIYTRGTSEPINIGCVSQEEDAFRMWSNNNINLVVGEGYNSGIDDGEISMNAPRIILGGVTYADGTINHKLSADFFDENDNLTGALYGSINTETGGSEMHVESRTGATLFLHGDSGIIKYNGTLEQNSSIRYKENVTEITDEYADKILELIAKEYDYKSTGKHSLGFIAEEVIKVLPQIVGVDSIGRPDSIAYIELIPLLVQVIQRLDKRVKQLENK